MWRRNLAFGVLCVAGLVLLVSALSPDFKPIASQGWKPPHASDADFARTVDRVNESFRGSWTSQGLHPAPRAESLTIARRLSLALTGTIPSLEEIRRFEATPEAERLPAWTARLLADSRYHAYFAERLARAYVGLEDGSLIIFRRRRFVAWIAEHLRDDRPYDAMVRKLIASTGLATNEPAVNFLSVTIHPENKQFQVDEKSTTARVARSMLGVRIDCAECHDHPFEPWKQADYESLSAFFGRTMQKPIGLVDQGGTYEVEDRVTGKKRTVEPRVPFDRELLPADGTPRERLARWLTDPRNEHFSAATVNRVWALMFGRGLVEPIDDLGRTAKLPPALTILADDFVHHGYSVRRLVSLIAATEVFQLDSRLSPNAEPASLADQGQSAKLDAAWGVFPLRRLRAEQVVGAIEQAASLVTHDSQTHLLVRIKDLIDQNSFIRRYGDQGADELIDAGGTIPQRLLMMNGQLVKNVTSPNPVNSAATRIGFLAHDDRTAVETAYLAVLTRRPTADEAAHFAGRLAKTAGGTRNTRMEDLYWALLNSSEFAWNH